MHKLSRPRCGILTVRHGHQHPPSMGILLLHNHSQRLSNMLKLISLLGCTDDIPYAPKLFPQLAEAPTSRTWRCIKRLKVNHCRIWFLQSIEQRESSAADRIANLQRCAKDRCILTRLNDKVPPVGEQAHTARLTRPISQGCVQCKWHLVHIGSPCNPTNYKCEQQNIHRSPIELSNPAKSKQYMTRYCQSVVVPLATVSEGAASQ
mmetsp:Transcript_18342/g.42954  ORF Transcript_18342/g.42954 Transcript_18342/m.42954 type:complete len:206 (+) Transcript_18342:169-786(+)